MTFDLYFAGSSGAKHQQFLIEQKAHMLRNYLNEKNSVDNLIQLTGGKYPGKLFIDSGAFSAWTKGKIIDVDEYIDWINERADFIDLYGQVDVIPGDIIHGATREQVKEAARLTWENYLYMRPKMKKPENLLYTFHVGEPIEYLKQALSWKDDNGKLIPYIALGGMVGKSTTTRKNFLELCFNTIKNSDNPKVKVHAFGMTSIPLLGMFPIDSADSTSWLGYSIYGNIIIDSGIVAVSEGKARLAHHYSHIPKHCQDEFEKSLAEFGFTLTELRSSMDNITQFNIKYMLKKAEQINKKGHRRGIARQSLF